MRSKGRICSSWYLGAVIFGCLLFLHPSSLFAAPPKYTEELYEEVRESRPAIEVGSCGGDEVAVAVVFADGRRLWATNVRWVWLENETIFAGIIERDELVVVRVEPLDSFSQRYPMPCDWLALRST